MYEGEWALDNFHGQGVWTTVAGDKYEGTFRDGLHHGSGTMKYATGDKCAGPAGGTLSWPLVAPIAPGAPAALSDSLKMLPIPSR